MSPGQAARTGWVQARPGLNHHGLLRLEGQRSLKDRGQPCPGACQGPGNWAVAQGSRFCAWPTADLSVAWGGRSASLALTFLPKMIACDSGAQKVPSHPDVLLSFTKSPALENKGEPQNLVGQVLMQ